MLFCLNILKLCLKTPVSKGEDKPISRPAGGDDMKTDQNLGVLLSVQRQTYKLIFLSRKTKERKINELNVQFQNFK